MRVATNEIKNEGAAVFVREGDEPSVRYVSDLTIYDEGLVDGHWIGRYWSTTGVIRPEKDIVPDLARLRTLDLDAFRLVIDGQDLRGRWQWEGSDTQSDTRGQHVIVRLRHEVRPVALAIHTRLDGSGILVRWLEITNTADTASALVAVAPFAGLLWRVANPTELITQQDVLYRLGRYQIDAWGHEGAFGWQDLPRGVTRVEGRRGRSGHGRPTLFAQNGANGEIAVVDLAWSGNWAYTMRRDEEIPGSESSLLLEIGPDGRAPQRILEPGETISTPEVHLGLLHGDLDSAVQALHLHLRSTVLPSQPEGRAQRVEANHWGYVADRVDPEFLKHDIDVAAAVGCELYILDAGWYGTEPGEWYWTVGDWSPGTWMPGGIEQIRAHARASGLLFGLWMEAECVGSKSRLFAEHPDWVLRRDGRPVGREADGKGHYALDLGKPEVAEWVEVQIAEAIERYDLDLFRLDYNVDMWSGGETLRDGYVEGTLWRYYEALYGIFDRIRARFPHVILENCSSGGGRTDLGLSSRFHTVWTSDWAQAPRGLGVLNGLTLALPPELCNRIAGVMNPDQWMYGDLDFQLRVAFMGHPVFIGIGPAVDALVPAHRARVEHMIGLYKDFIRPLLTTSRVFHHTPALDAPEAEGRCVLEYAAPDGERALAAVFRLTSAPSAAYRFRPRGLDRGKRYRVTFDNTGETVVLSGLELQRDGLELYLPSPLSSELLLFEVQS